MNRDSSETYLEALTVILASAIPYAAASMGTGIKMRTYRVPCKTFRQERVSGISSGRHHGMQDK